MPTESSNLVYKFETDGSRDLYELVPTIDKQLFEHIVLDNGDITKFFGGIFLFDQEPLTLDTYDFYKIPYSKLVDHKLYLEHFSKVEYILMHLSRMHTPIICHSEQNSKDIDFLTSNGILEVYYWYHGLISRDWFRHWKHYTPLKGPKKRFGCYVRDTSGTRKYRQHVLDFIQEQPNIYCPILEGNLNIDSNASARIDWNDTKKFDIQIVAETLFETDKIYLTEKVFKPIVMFQPFLLFGPPNSLQYIRAYGFETYHSIWDESYDQITDHQKRLQKLTNLIQEINSLSESDYQYMIEQSRAITEYNQQHFFSEEFERILTDELHINFSHAIKQQQINFSQDPGGHFFEYLDNLYRRSCNIGNNVRRVQDIFAYSKEKYPNVYNQLLDRYIHLLK